MRSVSADESTVEPGKVVEDAVEPGTVVEPPTVIKPGTAFVLGGGGVLGSVEVGMLRALFERGVVPELVIGSSVGALNGALVAADPTSSAVDTLGEAWAELRAGDLFSGSVLGRVRTLMRHGTHLHPNEPLRRLIDDHLPGARIEDLVVPFQCVATSIEQARSHWFTSGPLADAVLASCAVPGLLPPVMIDGQHYYDGGLVRSVPVGRAVELGARRIFVLHAGRLDRALTAPRKPWEVGMVALEIARRNRFVEEIASLPAEVEAHILPSGTEAPAVSVRYRDTRSVKRRMEAAYRAASAYLDAAGVV